MGDKSVQSKRPTGKILLINDLQLKYSKQKR
jgi:hypothetical protein